ncbi:MAG TPA: M23 family metallopeptidase [Peptococcaceae bacterium]|nr:M23 family metallopeptidase [Peptococcaceae bacterium]
MKNIDYRLKKIFTLIVVLILLSLLLKFIWQIFVNQSKAQAKDYQSLAAIPPELIISVQKTKPGNWQDYASILIAIFLTHSSNSAEAELPMDTSNSKPKDYYYLILSTDLKIQFLLTQLDTHVAYKNLDWEGVDPELRKKANYYRQLFEKYPIFEPDKYQFPLAQSCYYTDTYGAAREGGARRHEGTDLFAAKGTPIYSVSSGKVERLGWNRLGGERVGVRGEDGNYYYYAHLDTINKSLSIGTEIKPGDFLGTMGNTGDALTTPDHLHFGIELPNGEWLNPYSFLKVWEYHKFNQ